MIAGNVEGTERTLRKYRKHLQNGSIFCAHLVSVHIDYKFHQECFSDFIFEIVSNYFLNDKNAILKIIKKLNRVP